MALDPKEVDEYGRALLQTPERNQPVQAPPPDEQDQLAMVTRPTQSQEGAWDVAGVDALLQVFAEQQCKAFDTNTMMAHIAQKVAELAAV